MDNTNVLRRLIRETILTEFGPIKGKLRKPTSKSRQFNTGYVESDNRELGLGEVESMFPGAIDAWIEVAPEVYPDAFSRMHPTAIKNSTLWFKIGDQLRVAKHDFPQIELMFWDPNRQDWIEMDYI